MKATITGHLKRAAVVMGVLRKHGAAIDDLADDLPKAIALGADLHAALHEATVDASVASAKETSAHAPMHAPKVTAEQAIAHVKEKGLSEHERAAFDRATAGSG